MTNQDMIKGKLEYLKFNLAQMWDKFAANEFAVPKQKLQHVRRKMDGLLHSPKVQENSSDQLEEFRFNESREEDLPLSIHHDWQDEEIDEEAELSSEELITAEEAEEFGEDGLLDEEESEQLLSNRGGQQPDGVKYSITENNPLARDAEKVESVGIDKFGEADTFDPDEADEHQTFHDRKQNSDLNKRYGVRGLSPD
jgi:hypothetical protein